jgi:site-specific recombinase XerD
MLKKAPAALRFEDLDADFILKFLDYLEQERGNSERTRNLRLAAIRSFLRYVSYRLPGSLSSIQQVLAIPLKRFDRPSLEFLQREEVEAIITAPDITTFSGHRDFVMFLTLYNTGARVSEFIRLQVGDVCPENKASILIHGKGRKQRTVPLWKSTQRHLKTWLLRWKSAVPADRSPDQVLNIDFIWRCKRPQNDSHPLKNGIYLHKPSVIPPPCISFSPVLILQLLPSGLDMKVRPPLICMLRLI